MPDATMSGTNIKLRVTTSETSTSNTTTNDTASSTVCNAAKVCVESGNDTKSNTTCDTGVETLQPQAVLATSSPSEPEAYLSTSDSSQPATGVRTSDDENLANALLGKLLVGTYLVKNEIKKPGPRRVFEGTDIRNDSQVAIVILPGQRCAETEHQSKEKQPVGNENKNRSAQKRKHRSSIKKQSHNDLNESALLQLERDTGIRVRAYESQEKYSYCVISLESLDEFENPQPKPIHIPAIAAHRDFVPGAAISALLAFTFLGWLYICMVPGFTFGFINWLQQMQPGAQPINISRATIPEEVSVPLTKDTDLNPTNDFIAFDHMFVDGYSPEGRVNMTGINRVVAQSVIVSLNARDINTNSAVFHAQCVASAAKNVARDLKESLVSTSMAGYTPAWGGSGRSSGPLRSNTSCFAGEAQSTNVYFPNSLTSAMSVSYPSSLKSQSPGSKRHNGDEYMAGYSKIQVPVGDTTIDIAGVPVFPLRTNDLLTIDDIKGSKDADPIQSDYLPPNAILVGDDTTSKYSELVPCSAFGAADKDYPACIPRGYVRITNGPPPRIAGDGPVSEKSFMEDWEPSLDLPWIGELKWNNQVRRDTTNVPFWLDKRFMTDDGEHVRTSKGLVGSPLAFIDRIGQSNPAGESFFLQRVTARMKQVDPSITMADVKAALKQAKMSYAGEPMFLYSPAGPGSKLKCDMGYPYMSKTVPNDGLNSAAEVSCERRYNILHQEARGEKPEKVLISAAERAIFTPATGWRNLLGDITFEYETTKDSDTFTKP